MSKEKNTKQSASLDEVANLLRELISEVHELRQTLLSRLNIPIQPEFKEPVSLDSAAILSLRGKGLAVTIQKLSKLRIATTEEISAITNKERSQESANLNALVHLGHSRKLRIGRLVFYSTLPQAELDEIAALPRQLQELAIILSRETSGVLTKEEIIENLRKFGHRPRGGVKSLEKMLEELSNLGFPLKRSPGS